MTPIEQLSKELREAREKAHRHICDLASGKKKWEMCIPVQPTDSDMTLQAPLDLIEPIIDELDRLIEVEKVLVEVMGQCEDAARTYGSSRALNKILEINKKNLKRADEIGKGQDEKA